MGISFNLAKRFWKNTAVSGDNDCWVIFPGWPKPIHRPIALGSRKLGNTLSHRLSWEIHNGEIPSDKLVCHKCDNPPCVNPKHLYLGTHKENTADIWNRGRGDPPRGTRAGSSKLTENQVREIRVEYAEGENSSRIIGLKYGVGHTTILETVKRKRYSDIN